MTSTMKSNTGNLAQTTMYNLHTKRTLPRDVIKWMQGLDLSYSVKDYRKDMSNGFLIAQIISRYQPGRIPMHAFENSHNQVRRDNNWTQLELFFSKNSLRTIQIGSQQYSKIKTNNDPRAQHLYNFICRLYSICTKRSIPQNPPMLDLPPTQNQNPNLTTSYLLRDDGLQKLQNSGVNSNNGSQLNNSGMSEKLQDRVPTRKISPSFQAANMVDATSVGIKATQGRRMTSKRKSWNFQQKEESNDSQENVQSDKLIFDYLHDIMQECLPNQDPSVRQLLFPDSTKFTPTEILSRNIQTIDQQYLKSCVTQISLSIDQLVPIILREINETWKFFTYFLRLIKYLSDNGPQLNLIFNVISLFARTCSQKEPKRLGKVFYDSFLTIIISQVKATNYWRKKEKIMNLVYDFSGRQLEDRKNVLAKLKDEIGSNNTLYIQWLSVLIKQQTQPDKNSDLKLLDDYIYYAQQYVPSSIVLSRTSAFKILHEISKKNASLIDKFFIGKAEVFRHCRGDPEQVYLLIQIYFNIINQIIKGRQYQTLVKGVGSNNLVKAYNPDNQKNAEQLKNKVNLLAQTIKLLSENCANSSVRELCAKNSILYIVQSKNMMLIFLDYVYNLQNKEWFFTGRESMQHEFKSMQIQSKAIDLSNIKDASNEILIEIISLKNNSNYSIEEFLYLINVCLESLNVKKINMEFWEDVSLNVVKTFTNLITDLDHCQGAVQGLIKIFHIYFNYDMKIRQLSLWIAQAINTFYESSNLDAQLIKTVEDAIGSLNKWLNEEYQKSRNQTISFIVGEISDNIINPEKKLIYLKI